MVVLTTYEMVGRAGNSCTSLPMIELLNICWFRIVLDKAQWVHYQREDIQLEEDLWGKNVVLIMWNGPIDLLWISLKSSKLKLAKPNTWTQWFPCWGKLVDLAEKGMRIWLRQRTSAIARLGLGLGGEWKWRNWIRLIGWLFFVAYANGMVVFVLALKILLSIAKITLAHKLDVSRRHWGILKHCISTTYIHL
jgi:hypothetical protein